MKTKVMSGVILVLIVATGYLFYQNYHLNQELNQLKKVSITPGPPPEMNQPPSPTSPFDNPKNDPTLQTAVASKEPLTSIQFEKMSHNFGKIKEGEKVKTVFKFKNTGSKPLIISSATGSCGCTVPDFPRNPIKSGETGEINVEFDSSGKSGENDKSVTVVANTEPANIVLSVKSTVIPKD